MVAKNELEYVASYIKKVTTIKQRIDNYYK